MEIKYTSDNKKVIVVGKLNAQETIVQEIFVAESGAEIASGENFVVKSLHDTPVRSWKEKSLADIEERYDKERKTYEERIRKQDADYRKMSSTLKEKYEFVAGAIKNISPKTFELLGRFLEGRINWLVFDSSYEWTISKFDDAIKNGADYYNSLDRIKLITLFGKDDGTLKTRINRYSDGSGSDDSFTPFENYEDALAYVKSWIDSDTLNGYKIKSAQHYDIPLDKKRLKVYTDEVISAKQKQISSKMEAVEKIKIEIEELNSGKLNLPK